MDVGSKTVFEINHNEKKIFRLRPIERVPHDLIYVSSRPDTTLLGRECAVKIYKRFDMTYLDTMKVTYYLARSLPLTNAGQLAEMQGRRNTLIADGSNQFIPLRVVMKWPTGRTICVQALSVTEKAARKETFEFPDYPVEYEGG
jgi:hypothetical protein